MANPSVVVAFGPGGKRGCSVFTREATNGRAIDIICAAPTGKTSSAYPKAGLLTDGAMDIPKSWEEQFAPRLVTVGKDRVPTIDNRFSRLLGAPPIIVAGMTPWSHYQQVGAVNEAGYVSELAGGGIPLPHLFEKEVRDLAEIIPSGQGINCNLLFLNPYLWGFQFPLIEKLCAKGEPIDSITVAAGVPGAEKAREIVLACKRSGMRYISFKPGNAEMIEQVLALARDNQDINVVIQFTGGRAGGHHSFEDQFEPLLKTYSKIREHKNVFLVVGGGLGDADSCYEFLSGNWSLQFGQSKMPADGVLLGTRMLATAEAATCDGAKDIIVAAQGVEDQADWEKSYKGDAGGVITVQSELGEPIHVANNRCSRLWRDFDTRYFSNSQGAQVAPDEMVALLEANKQDVIASLNKDYQKPWFGKKKTGEVCDVHDMTYEEVALRLTELHWYNGTMPGKPQPRWFDVSFRERVFDWLQRTEERFCCAAKPAEMHNPAQLEHEPLLFLQSFFEKYPAATETRLTAADVDYFMANTCGVPTRKPINFIPSISTMFKRYFKTDSLWYSELVEAVPGFEAERSFIICGPVATKYNTHKNETVKEVLDGIRDGMIEILGKSNLAPANLEELPHVDQAALDDATCSRFEQLLDQCGASCSFTEGGCDLQLGEAVPAFEDWVKLLTTIDHSSAATGAPKACCDAWHGARWLKALLESERVQRGDRRARNFVPHMLQPVKHGRVTFRTADDNLTECCFHLHGNRAESVLINFQQASQEINFTCTYHAPSGSERGAFPLDLRFKYCPGFRSCPLHEMLDGRNERIKSFYSRVWLDQEVELAKAGKGPWNGSVGSAMTSCPSSGCTSEEGLSDSEDEPQRVLAMPRSAFSDRESFNAGHLRNFCIEVGQVFETYVAPQRTTLLPIDFSIVVCWKAMIRSVLNDRRIGSVDLLRLLHLENRFKLLNPRVMQGESDEFESSFSLTEISNTPTGKRVTSRGRVIHECVPWVEVTSTFFIPFDVTSSDEQTAAKGNETFVTTESYEIKITDDATLAVIQDKDFLSFEEELKVGDKLRVELTSYDAILQDKSRNVRANGVIFRDFESIGSVEYEVLGVMKNALLEFLERFASAYPPFREIEGYEMLKQVDVTTAPLSMDRYSSISGDINPIHTDEYFARLGGNTQPIVHGMWLTANARRVIGTHVGKCETCRTQSFQCFFREKVIPGDTLRTSLRHVGMRQGNLVVAFETYDSKATLVCSGFADVEQPKCALTFTGQGSVRVGMGMDLYEMSETSRRIWDEADQYFLAHYGFSIIKIVKENPKEKTIYFGGPSGAKIRDFYKSLTRTTSDGEVVPLFPEIKSNSMSFTFRAPAGILFATQFTQPALVLAELAQYHDGMDKLCFPKQFYFAGHSLGEYAAITAVAGCLSIPDLMDVVFLRGMTMQSVVPRDNRGRSDYGMIAVDPTRVTKGWNVKNLQDLIACIDGQSGGLLQIVNYNIDPTQYVVAGDLACLHALMHACNSLKRDGSLEASQLASESIAIAQKERAAVDFRLVRGSATIPLEGIDVPFHSRFLLSGVNSFRKILEKKFSAADIQPAKLEEFYIPNLVAKPFSLAKSFAEDVQSVANSPVLEPLLPDWNNYAAVTPKAAACTLLIELLAYQFASPVRWTETTEVLLSNAGVRKFCELGPAPVLVNMLKATLAKNRKFSTLAGKIESFSFAMDSGKIYFKNKSAGASAKEVTEKLLQDAAPDTSGTAVSATVAASAPAAPSAAAAPVVVVAPAAVAAPTLAAGGDDVNAAPSALNTIKVVLSQRLGKPIDQIDDSATIKKLSGGKSALQNELVGDLGKEFADADSADLEDAADISLATFASKVQASYKKLGKIVTEILNKMVSQKLPAGATISKVKSAFQEEFTIGSAGVDGALVSALVLEPADRLDTAGLAAWKTNVAKHYGNACGESVGARGGGAVGPATGAVAVGAVDPRMAAKLNLMVKDLSKAYCEYLEQDPLKDAKLLEMEQSLRMGVDSRLLAITSELGEDLVNGVKPIFSAEKVREYNAWWAVAKRDALLLWQDLKTGLDCEDLIRRLRNRMTPEVQKLLAWLAERSTDNVATILSNLSKSPVQHAGLYQEQCRPTAPHVEVRPDGNVAYSEHPRSGQSTTLDYVESMSSSESRFLSIARPSLGTAKLDQDLTQLYFDGLRDMVSTGVSFKGQVALITGAGPTSISAPVVMSLLAGGCTVICSFQRSRYDWFERIYEQSAGTHGRLIAVPYNCASVADMDSVLEYVYDTLKLDVDFCFPFAALPENGRALADIDSKSELAHRVMLSNVMRLVGKIKVCKEQRNILGKVCTVVVPLSPNMGQFGHDGLYAESKLGLATLFNKWSSEKIQDYIAVIGADIGWTRGTGLMNANNIVSAGVEEMGMRTFTVAEMAFNLMGLLHPSLVQAAQLSPMLARLTGGMECFEGLAECTSAIRTKINLESARCKAVHKDRAIDQAMEEHGSMATAQKKQEKKLVQPRAVPGRRFLFPKIASADQREELGLRGMADPASVVVVTGFGEVGPWGNATTRWEMESDGEFSLEGCIEMAWMMGFIKYFNGRMNGKDGKPVIHNGWVDAQKNEPLADWEVKARFEKDILAHTGIRVLEPELFWNYDPRHGANFYHQVHLERDLERVEVSDEETAREFQKMHGDSCDAYCEDGVWYIQLRQGGTILIPRSLQRDRWVAGQVPTGWSAKTYGIPDDVINQVDRVTLFSLVAFVESLVHSGITDPYEFYKYVHVSKVGNALGSGMGGMHAIRECFHNTKMSNENRVQGDVLQETFINTTAAWINLLLLSCSGPIKTPVGACATAMESFAIAYDTISSGQAKLMVAGACDDLNEESMREFASMKATANSDLENAKARDPKQMCRPMTSSRSGFMESHGSGVHVLMSGDLAIEMGVPIYAVVGLVHTAMDREGRSVPAPGKGVLSVAAEAPSAKFSPLLRLPYRRQQLEAELAQAKEWKDATLASLDRQGGEQSVEDLRQTRVAILEEFDRMVADAKRKWGTEWWKGHPSISPLRGALASWNLTVDDIAVASCHGTSTKLNDKNESDILNTEMETLGRREGNPLLIITQKWLTGHPKGPASAWQAGGVIQAMQSGRVPGNRNLDNVDEDLNKFKHLLYSNQTLDIGKIKAACVTSFGFGQAGGQMLLVHPDYFLATLSDEVVEAYTTRRDGRQRDAVNYHEDVMVGRKKFVQVKTEAPYPSEDTKDWLLQSDRRMPGASDPAEDSSVAVSDANSEISTEGSFSFVPRREKALSQTMESVMKRACSSSSVGIDVEPITNPCFSKESFLERNYTERERADCALSTRSFAGLWAGKEAVVKVLGNAGAQLKSAGSSLQDLELLRNDDGTITCHFHGAAAEEAARVGVNNVMISLSYADNLAVAAAAAS